jgi:hypothetical protein
VLDDNSEVPLNVATTELRTPCPPPVQGPQSAYASQRSVFSIMMATGSLGGGSVYDSGSIQGDTQGLLQLIGQLGLLGRLGGTRSTL